MGVEEEFKALLENTELNATLNMSLGEGHVPSMKVSAPEAR